MFSTLQLSDFRSLLKYQIIYFGIFKDDLQKRDQCLKYSLLKMQGDVRLRNFGLHTGFRKFFINSPRIDRAQPP